MTCGCCFANLTVHKDCRLSDFDACTELAALVLILKVKQVGQTRFSRKIKSAVPAVSDTLPEGFDYVMIFIIIMECSWMAMTLNVGLKKVCTVRSARQSFEKGSRPATCSK